MRKVSITLFGGVCAAIALIGFPILGQTSARADVLIVSDVAASIAAPASAISAFAVVGTITNTGNITQPSGSTLSFNVTNGSVGSAPAGCTVASGTAVCTVGQLSPGAAQSFSFGVSPAMAAQSVTSTATVKAAILEQNVLDPTNNTASAVTNVAYGVDGSLANRPTDVRFGSDTLLTSTVTNTKAPQTVNVRLVTGGIVDSRIALPAGCSVTDGGANVACAFVLGIGQSKSFDTAVTVPTSGSSITSTLNISGSGGGTKSVSKVTNLSSYAQAFVPAGDHLTFQGSNQFTDFIVPDLSAPGLFLDLHEVTLNNVQCGTSPCIKQAAEAIFPADGTYSGSDPTHPFVWNIKYNDRQVCNGYGAGCLIRIYWIPTGQTATKSMGLCPTYGTTLAPALNTVDEPCLQKVDKTQKGYATYTVALLRDIVIPIIGSVSAGPV